VDSQLRVSASRVPRFIDHLQLDSAQDGGYAIACDFHAPCHSALWTNRLLTVCERYRLESLILAGDGLDMSAFSHWGADVNLPWSEEMEAAGEWLWVIYQSFRRVYWLTGNHEARPTRLTAGQLPPIDLVDAVLTHHARDTGQEFKFFPGRIAFSIYSHCYVDDEWMVVHPKSYSRIPGRIANQLALIHGKHVVAAHSHRANWGWADDGKHVIVDTGGMFDEELVRYRHLQVTTHPAWNHGFVVYRDGHAALFTDSPYTDWRLFETEKAA
jgi:hypothetical protein